MRVILASQSPRRKELLKYIVPDFEVVVSCADEHITPGIAFEQVAMDISYQKAKDVFDRTSGDRIVIGSDTMVIKDGKIYGKPADEMVAKRYIKELLLGDRSHLVITGTCVLVEKNGVMERFDDFDSVKVYFSDISDEEIDGWIATGKAMDKAGAYAVQEEFGVFVERIEGNYSALVGLSTPKVYGVIKRYV